MKTHDKLKTALIELSNEVNLEDITVVLLCEKISIKRQAFYYHYRDIYDLIDSIFIDEETKFFGSKLDLETLQNKMINQILDYEVFYGRVAKSNVADILINFVYDCLYYNLNNFFSVNSKNKSFLIRGSCNTIAKEIVYLFINNLINKKSLTNVFYISFSMLKRAITEYE